MQVNLPSLKTAVQEAKKEETSSPVAKEGSTKKEKKEKKPKTASTKTEKKPKAEGVKKEQKSSQATSCFSCRKQSKTTKQDDIKAPVSKTAPPSTPTAVVAEINPEAKKENTDTAGEKQLNLPPENWAVGLDRKEDEPVLVKDPPKSHKVEAEATKSIDLPSVIELVAKLPAKEEKKEEAIIEQHDDTIKQEDAKTETQVGDASKEKEETKKPDLSGAHIVIDRRPDHASVPIVTHQQTQLPKITIKDAGAVVDATTATTTTTASGAVLKESTKKQKIPKEKPKKSAKKTSLIDLPLLKILGPSKKKEDKTRPTTIDTPAITTTKADTLASTKEAVEVSAPLTLPELKIEALTISQDDDNGGFNEEDVAADFVIVKKEDVVQEAAEEATNEAVSTAKLTLEMTVDTNIKSETRHTVEATYLQQADLEKLLDKLDASDAQLKEQVNKEITATTGLAMIEGETSNQVVEFEFKKHKAEIVSESEMSKFTQVLNELKVSAGDVKEAEPSTLSPSQIEINRGVADVKVTDSTPEKIPTSTHPLTVPDAENAREVRVSDVVVLPSPAQTTTTATIEPPLPQYIDATQTVDQTAQAILITKKDVKETKEVKKPKEAKKPKEPKEPKAKTAKEPKEPKVKTTKEPKESSLQKVVKEPKPKQTKHPKESQETDKKTKKSTSCMDMPLIDILVPKSVKIAKKQEEIKSKLDDSSAQPASTLDARPLDASPVDHGDLFKGLDPAGITHTDKYPTSSVDVKPTLTETVVRTEETLTVTQELVKVPLDGEENQKETVTKVKIEKKVIEETLDVPSVIDIAVKPRVDTWTTDPLPSAVIGLHKLGAVDVAQPLKVVSEATLAQEVTPAQATSTTSKAPTPKDKKKKSPKQQKKPSGHNDNDDDASKVSCFSCKSKKATKEKIQKTPEQKPTTPQTEVKPVVSAAQDLTLTLVNLDAPPKDQVDIKTPTVMATADASNSLVTIVKEASIANEKAIGEEVKHVSDSIIEKIETAAIAEAINDEEKVVVQIVEVTPSAPAATLQVETPTIEATKEQITAVSPPITKPKVETGKSKKAPSKKSAEKSKEEKKKSDPFLIRSSVSCFACKSKKAKKSDVGNVVVAVPDVAVTVPVTGAAEFITSEEESKLNLSPQIGKGLANSDLFKGLDKPSVSECLHISDHQSFLDFKVEEINQETPSPLHVTTNTITSERQETKKEEDIGTVETVVILDEVCNIFQKKFTVPIK